MTTHNSFDEIQTLSEMKIIIVSFLLFGVITPGTYQSGPINPNESTLQKEDLNSTESVTKSSLKLSIGNNLVYLKKVFLK